MAPLADHDGQLTLVVDLIAAQLPGEHDRIAGILERARVLHEEHGVGRRFGAALSGVLLVVESDAENVAWHERGEQFLDGGRLPGVA